MDQDHDDMDTDDGVGGAIGFVVCSELGDRCEP